VPRKKHLPVDQERLTLLRSARVEPVPGRCVQCGLCSYNCPTGIDVRGFARRGRPIDDARCIKCGTCVARCPRAVLQFGPVPRAIA
jgi:NosR/NirI family nitrous oxide reductase transcriptional regulator